jgi:hypothetical protein
MKGKIMIIDPKVSFDKGKLLVELDGGLKLEGRESIEVARVDGDKVFFYVESFTEADLNPNPKVYSIVTRLARRGFFRIHEYLCTCPDFRYRRWPTNETCKHINLIKLLALLVGNGEPRILAEKIQAAKL